MRLYGLFEGNFRWERDDPQCTIYVGKRSTGEIVVRLKTNGVTHTISGQGENITCDVIPSDVRYLDLACHIIMYQIKVQDHDEFCKISGVIYKEYKNDST